MNTIQSGMLIGLGFLAATLLGLLLAPAFWRRAVRLTSRRIKETIPLSEVEIEADRDRIRAEYAIKMHKLETLVEQVKLGSARQQIEINRRDARVNMLEADLERLKASYEEAQNARRVLEQTIADRLPKVESRLTDAKKLLFAREREVGELTRTGERQIRALAEASSINAQQQSEIERLSASVAALAARSTGSTEGEAALKSELDALRSKTREQAQLLARMQSLAGRPAGIQAAAPPSVAETAGGGEDASAERAGVPSAAEADLQRQLRTLRARNDDQAAEIARLKAGIAVFEREAESDGKVSIRESRIALKARVQSLEAQATQQSDTIQKLRGELAAANERQARQAAHFTGELRRLNPTSGGPRGRRSESSARSSLAERVAQSRGPAGESEAGNLNGSTIEPATATAEPDLALAVVEAGGPEAKPQLAAGAPARNEAAELAPAAPESKVRDAEEKPEAAAAAGASKPAGGRPRLLDRIAGLSRTP